jgi:hypothetical protein
VQKKNELQCFGVKTPGPERKETQTMLIQVNFEGSSEPYTYHCPDDTDVRVGDKVDVGSKRKPTVVAVGEKSNYVKDIVRVLPRPRFRTDWRGTSGFHSEHDWETFEDARDYLNGMLKYSSPTLVEVKLTRCDDR